MFHYLLFEVTLVSPFEGTGSHEMGRVTEKGKAEDQQGRERSRRQFNGRLEKVHIELHDAV